MNKKLTIHSNLKPECILNPLKIIRITEFNEASYGTFMDDLEKIRAAKQEIIPIHIDSFGGQVYALLGMVNALLEAPETIVTYVGTKAMSCGSILLSCGTPGYRFVAPHSTTMIHSVSGGAWGKIGDVIITAEHGKDLNDRLFEILSKNAGKKKNFFKKFLKEKTDRDVYLTAEETVYFGLADRVGIPTLEMEVSQSFRIGV